jgi:hypothetical protein
MLKPVVQTLTTGILFVFWNFNLYFAGEGLKMVKSLNLQETVKTPQSRKVAQTETQTMYLQRARLSSILVSPVNLPFSYH